MNTLLRIRIQVIAKELAKLDGATKALRGISTASKAATVDAKQLGKAGEQIAKLASNPGANPFGISVEKLQEGYKNTQRLVAELKKAKAVGGGVFSDKDVQRADRLAAASARLGEQRRKNNATIAAGQTRLGQGQQRIDNAAATSTTRLGQAQQRIDNAKFVSISRLGQAQQKINLAQANAQTRLDQGQQRTTATILNGQKRVDQGQQRTTATILNGQKRVDQGQQRTTATILAGQKRVDQGQQRTTASILAGVSRVAIAQQRANNADLASTERQRIAQERLDETKRVNAAREANRSERNAAADKRRDDADLARARKQGEAAARAAAKAASTKEPGFLSRVSSSDNQVMRSAKNMQWIGRQLEFNFTLPIVAAGAAAMKWAMDVERSMTKVRKVYGDGVNAGVNMERVMGQLREVVDILSIRFAVNADQVAEMMSKWAAAGYTGAGLAEMTNAAFEAMSIGDFTDTQEAFEALIAVQQAYGLNAGQVTQAMANLNAVENETAVGFADIIKVIARAGSIAESSGVSINWLAAAAAQLVPALGGSAEQAGTGIRSIIARFMAPDDATKEVFTEIGLGLEEMLNLPFEERFQQFAEAVTGLSDAERIAYEKRVGTLWQVNRLDALIKGVTDETSTLSKAQAVQADAAKNISTYRKELEILLNSDPKNFDRLVQVMRKGLIEAIMPAIPTIIALVGVLAQLMTKFSELSPETRNMILLGLAFLAILGPVMRVVGAIGMLGGLFKALVPGTDAVTKATRHQADAYNKAQKAAQNSGGKSFRTSLSDTVKAIGRGIAATMRWAFALVKGLAKALWTAGKFVGRLAWSILRTVIPAIWRAIAATASWVWSQMKSLIPAVGRAVAALARLAWSFATTVVKAIASAVLATVRFAAAQVASLIPSIYRAVVGLAVQAGAYVAAAAAAVASGATAAAAWLLPYWPIIVIGLAIIALATLIWVFRDNIWKALKAVAGFFRGLYDHVVQTLKDLWSGIKGVLTSIKEGINSALNPFATHSPSLVTNVNRGVDIIAKKYATLAGIGRVFSQAADDFKAFSDAVAGYKESAKLTVRAEQRSVIVGFAPDAGDEVDAMYASIDALAGSLELIQVEIDKQRVVVDAATDAYEGWAAMVDDAIEALEGLQKVAADLKEELDAAQDELDRFANAPIKGMKAMDDAIFANEIAQKKLRLEMAKIEQASGGFDEVSAKIAAVQGDIEALTGIQEDLRNAGAGSEITGAFDQQIAGLRSQQAAFEAQLAPIAKMRDELALLAQEAEILDLEQALAFDPLTRQIDDFIDSAVELPFEEIWAGVTTQKKAVDELTVRYEAATEQVTLQEKVLESLTASRDAAKKVMDDEMLKLKELEDGYAAVEAQMDALQQALDEFVSAMEAAQAAIDRMNEEPALGADFEPPVLPGDPLGGDLDDWLKKNKLDLGITMPNWRDIWQSFTEVMAEYWDDFKVGWGIVIEWIREQWFNFMAGLDIIWEKIKKFFKRLDPRHKESPSALENIQAGWQAVIDFIKELPGKIWDAIGDVGRWLWGKLKAGWEWLVTQFNEKKQAAIDLFMDIKDKIWEKVGDIGTWLWEKVSTGFASFKTSVSGIVDAVVGFFTGLPGRITEAATGIWNAAWGIGERIMNGITSGISGVIGIVSDIASALRSALGNIWNGVLDKVESGVNFIIDRINSIPGLPGSIDRVNMADWRIWTGAARDDSIPFMYHQGGWVKGAPGADVPIIAQVGEYVLSRADVKAIGQLGPLKSASIAGAGQGRNEGVVPAGAGNARVMVFNGDLSFPNISSGEDAEAFVRNLEILAVR